MIQIHRKRSLSFILFFFLALTTFFSCKDNLSDDLDEDFSTSYSYYPEESSGADSAVVRRYSIGETISDLPTVASPEFFVMKPGYKIVGWKFFKNMYSGSTERPDNVTMSEDGEKIAKITVTSAPLAFVVSDWKPVQYSVVFYGNGGADSSGATQTSQNLIFDEDSSLNENPFSLENYDFAGWGTSASQSPNFPSYADKQLVGAQTGINLANVEYAVASLYALWIRNFITITFDSNANDGAGGLLTGSMGEQTLRFKNLPDNLSANTFTREGHSFAGWNTASDGSGNAYGDGEQITQENYPLTDTTFYAQWQINTYQVDFDSTGGSAISSQTVNWNQNASKPSDPTRTGYDFAGWFTSTDGGATLSAVFDFSTPIKEDTILYAKWNEQHLNISFDKNASDGTGTISEQTVKFTDLPVNLTANTYDRTANGYYFNSWNSKADSTGYYYYDRYEINEANWDWIRQYAAGTVNLTLYAQWEIIHYNVNFDTRGGEWFAPYDLYSQQIAWHTTITQTPTEPKKAGFTFAGWYTSDDWGTTLSSSAFDFSTLITEDLTLYAKWDKLEFTITFDANGGTGTMSNQTVNGDDLSSGKALSANTFSREGYNFTGWSKNSSATTADFSDENIISSSNWDDLYESDGSVTLYAIWEEISYQVDFDTNGGSEIDSQTVYYWKNARKVTKPADPTRTGYIFTGWYKDSSLSTAFDFDSQISGDTTIYAKWEAETLTITFNANNGTGSTTEQTLKFDNLPKSLTSNGFTRTGYNFMGWATNSSATSKEFDKNPQITKDNWNSLYAIMKEKGTVTLYAIWEIKKFTVKFVDAKNGSTVCDPQTVEYNKKATEPSAPEETGYEFLGWDSKNGNSTAIENRFNFDTAITEDTTIYAKWKPEELKITFTPNGGTGSMTEQTLKFDNLPKPLTSNGFSKEGYDFVGWNTNANGSGTAYENKVAISSANWAKIRTGETITLYAQWEIKKFTVNFIDAIDLSTISSETVEYNGTITLPETNPTKEHYSFLGWDDSNANPTSMESAANLSTPVTSDRNIYAKWTPDTYTVTFNANGGKNNSTGEAMSPQIFTYGISQSLTKSTYEKSGYLFGGWSTSSAETTAQYGDQSTNFTPEADTTLYAVWTQRGSISREDGLSAVLDEENEQIVFSAGGDYASYMWVIDNNFGSSYGTTDSITIPYASVYANGQKHSVILISIDSNGDTVTESANFTILPKN